jgi:hypothetical protein
MEDRDFTEVDLRQMLETVHGLPRGSHHGRPIHRLMLETARGYREDPVMAGRFIVETQHGGAEWEVVVEPDEDDHWLVVVTAYPLGSGR